MAVSRTKNELRAQLKALRAALPADERAAADAAIAARVFALAEFQNADIVLTYLSFDDEVDTRAIIREALRLGKTVALPRVTGKREMRWFTVEGLDGLERSRFGIDEPPIDEARELRPAVLSNAYDVQPAAQPTAREWAIAFVPGLTFDPYGYRLGYGGGFYDVFLTGFGGTSIGLCRASQISGEPLPHDAHDIPVDMVVTDA